MVEVEDLLKNLNNIKEALNDNQYEMFLRNYDEWRCQREKSIYDFEKLKTKLHHEPQVEMGLGTAVWAGIVGVGAFVYSGGNAIVGYVAAAVTAEESTRDKKVSLRRENNAIVGEEMKEILERDLKMTEELLPFLERAKMLDDFCNEIFHCSIHSDKFESVLTAIDIIIYLRNKGEYGWKSICNYVLSDKPHLLNTNFKTMDHIKIKKFFSELDSDIRQFLIECCNNPTVKQVALKIYKYCRSPIFNFLKQGALFLHRFQTNFPKTFNTLYTFTVSVINAVCIIKDIILRIIKFVSEIFSIKNLNDIYKETQKYSEMIDDIIKSLTWELDTLDQVYTEIRSRPSRSMKSSLENIKCSFDQSEPE